MPGTRPRKTTQRLTAGSGSSNEDRVHEDSVEGKEEGIADRANESPTGDEGTGGDEDIGGGVGRELPWGRCWGKYPSSITRSSAKNSALIGRSLNM